MKFNYIHFPKAGGTSLRSQLEQHYPDRLLFDYEHDPVGSSNAREVAALISDDIVGVCGHLHPSRYADQVEMLFTFLRDPVDNLISIYHFWLDFPRSGNAIHNRFLDEKPTIEQFAARYPLKNLMSELYFGAFDMSRFSFIGFHERRNADFAKLSDLLGISLDSGYHVNRTDVVHSSSRKQLAEDRNLMSRLRDILRQDVAFYEEALARF